MQRPAITVILVALGVVAAVEGAIVLRVIQSASNAAEWMSVEQSLAQETSSLARRVMADPYRRPAASDDDTDTARTTAAGPERAAALGAESPAIRAAWPFKSLAQPAVTAPINVAH